MAGPSLNNFVSMLFCTAIHDIMLIILMRITSSTLKETIVKFILSIYAMPVFHAADIVSCLTSN